LSAVFQFVGPRTFSSTASNRAGVMFDLDLDQDSATGFRPFKDSILIASAHPTSGYNGFDTLTSGTRAEYLVDMEPDPAHGDSAEIVHYSGYLSGTITALFMPGTCGPFMGFVLPWSILGGDDGNVNALATGYAETATDAYIDPMPLKGHLTLTLAGPAPPIGPVADLSAAFTPITPISVRRRIRPRIPLVPLR
jgi:hypothetical protein